MMGEIYLAGFARPVEYEELDNGCWIWQGYLDGFGYPLIPIYGKMHRAHRVVFEYFRHELGDLHLHHECEVTSCVNPDHLVPITSGDHNRLHKLGSKVVQNLTDEQRERRDEQSLLNLQEAFNALDRMRSKDPARYSQMQSANSLSREVTTVRDGELWCPRCESWKSDDEFYRSAKFAYRRNRQPYCKGCEFVYRKQRKLARQIGAATAQQEGSSGEPANVFMSKG